MPSAASTRTKAAPLEPVPADGILFAANLNAGRLADLANSAKAIGELLIMQLNSDPEANCHFQFWTMDEFPSPICAMVGQADGSLFNAIGGDDRAHTIQIPSKLLLEAVKAFDPKLAIDLRLRSDEGRYLLTLSQSKKDSPETDERIITVSPSQVAPKQPVIPKVAYAVVDLDRFKKVLNGLKKNTDVVTVSIGPGELEVTASTNRLKDGWRHATTSTGKAKGLFAVNPLKQVVAGAGAVTAVGEVYIAEDHPLRLEAVSEDVRLQFFVAGRETMK